MLPCNAIDRIERDCSLPYCYRFGHLTETRHDIAVMRQYQTVTGSQANCSLEVRPGPGEVEC